ncbi:hypothetical protein N9D23_00500 [Rubripirellula sp.]|nr:hypothetical protein [Rubripirellula sp.]
MIDFWYAEEGCQKKDGQECQPVFFRPSLTGFKRAKQGAIIRRYNLVTSNACG